MTTAPQRLRRTERRSIRRRRSRVRSSLLGLLAVGVLAVPVAPMLVLQQAQPPASDLVDELVSIEERLTGLAIMPDVEADPERTWGTIRGDFVGAAFQIDEVGDELTSLVERASEADGPVPLAVRDVASAYRTMREGYRHLEEYESAGLAVVVEDPDDDGGIGIEEARGHAEAGLRLLLEALAGFHEGYGVLRDAEAAADARSLFELRFSEVEQAAQSDGQDARVLLSYPATQLMVAVDRFGEEAATTSPARTVRYACVDREGYVRPRPGEPVPALPVPEGTQAQVPYPDCPQLPEDVGVSAVPPG